MTTTPKILSLAVLLSLTVGATGQDTSNPQTFLPSGVSLGCGLGLFSVRDEYISSEKYSGILPYINLEWMRFRAKSAYHLEFEYQHSTDITNNTISAEVRQFVFNQDYSYPVGSIPVFSNNMYAYLGPSVQFFFCDINYDFARPGTFISPNTFGIIGSLGVNCALIYPANEKLRMEGFLRSNLLSFGGKKINEYKYSDEPAPTLLTVFTTGKIDGDISIRYYLSRKVSSSLGYRFDLSRIAKWEPYIATSSSLVISVNYTF